MTIHYETLGAILLGALFAGTPQARGAGGTAEPTVTLSALLQEMTDRDAAAQWPSPAYVLKQASSHDRRKKDPRDAAGWHSNTDYGQFIRTETNEGRQEWVIMEDSGPGAIVRFWTPLNGEKDKQIIRFYFDGATTPGITANFNDLLSGRAFVRPPLAFISWNETDLRDELKPEFKPRRGVAGDMYLPIPFAGGCKITLDSVPFYYVINYRSYDAGTPVQTLTMPELDAAKAKLGELGEKLVAIPGANIQGKEATLAAGEELSIKLPSGPSSVRTIQVGTDPSALHSTILQASFDGEETIWCPVGEFFGTGARLHPVQDWWRTVSTNGTLTARWVMPFRHSGRLSLKNVGDKPVAVKLAAATGRWKWDERSLLFHANWHAQLGMKTRPISDWNYLEVQGQGRYVGDTLTVFSPVKEWYGEGDERIYYDGAALPAHIGTGTEDYYGYAWGMAGYFSSPFISMPQRDHAEQDWRGYTTTSRLRLLDSIPFRTALKHDIEIWNWADTKVDYEVGTFWYARPGARGNRAPQPQEAAQPIRDNPGESKIAGAVECETMKVLGQSEGLAHSTQSDYPFAEGSWSGGSQLFVQSKKPGDFIELLVADKVDGPRKLTLYATKSYDYGILSLSINGQKAGKDMDAYAPQPVISGPIELGVFEPKEGQIVLRVEVVGANPSSKGPQHYFGLDAVVLSPP